MRQLVLGDVVVGPDSEARDAHPGATWKFKCSGHQSWTCGLVPVAHQRNEVANGKLFQRASMALGGTYTHVSSCRGVTPKDSTVTITVTVTHTPKPGVWVAFDDETVLYKDVPAQMFPLRLAIMGWKSTIIELVT